MANENTGGTGNTNDDGSAAILAAAELMLNRHKGNAIRALQHTTRELERVRNRNRELEASLAEARKTVPADGSVVLSAADGKRWEAFAKLGKEADVIEKSLKDLDALKVQNKQRSFAEAVAAAAADLGWNPDALPMILEREHLAAEMREVTVQNDDGEREKIELLHVRPDGKADAPWEVVDQYLAREHAKYLPILETAAPHDAGARDDDDAAESDNANGNGAGRAKRAGVYRAASNGASAGAGVRFPAQRSPRERAGLTRVEQQRLLEEKARKGEYNAF
ncbi:MAG TPA: hypothetical protein VH539_12170 [Gemmatimonadaceae bacterium]|jgi:hypothetical protein